MSDERIWLSQTIDGTVRHFHCPADAAKAWADMGWQPAEAPPEPVDPAIAHLVEARRLAAEELAAQPAEAAEAADEPQPTTRTSSRAGKQTQE